MLRLLTMILCVAAVSGLAQQASPPQQPSPVVPLGPALEHKRYSSGLTMAYHPALSGSQRGIAEKVGDCLHLALAKSKELHGTLWINLVRPLDSGDLEFDLLSAVLAKIPQPNGTQMLGNRMLIIAERMNPSERSVSVMVELLIQEMEIVHAIGRGAKPGVVPTKSPAIRASLR